MKISAIIPAHNEEKTVTGVIKVVIDDVDEVIVVDSCSDDRTAYLSEKAGAKVVRSNKIGNHYAIRTGVAVARGADLVFVDADIVKPCPRIAKKLINALNKNPKVTIAKGYYIRPFNNQEEGGGRLTELCARPLLSSLLPKFSFVKQPLAGEFAVHKKDILYMPYAPGSAVDLGILLHCGAKGRIIQVDLGTKVHKHRPLFDLGKSAAEVTATILRVSGKAMPDTIRLKQPISNSVSCSYIKLKQLPPLKR